MAPRTTHFGVEFQNTSNYLTLKSIELSTDISSIKRRGSDHTESISIRDRGEIYVLNDTGESISR